MTVKKVIYLGFNDFKKHKRGVENVILSQAQSLGNSPIKVFYVYINERFKIHHYSNIVCFEIPNNVLRFIYLNIILLKIKRKYFEKDEPFFIHSHHYLLSFFSLFKTFVFTVHDGLFYAKNCEGSRLGVLWKIIEKNVYRRSKKIHFISDFSLQLSLLHRHNHAKKIVKIYDTTPLEKSSKNTAIKKENENEPFEILIVRSIETRANLDLIVDVAQLAKKTSANIKFIIIGKGPLLDYYKKTLISKDIKNIELPGYLPDEDLRNYYSKCDLVLVPCLYGEGFGLPVIEGYLFNKPVLASNTCALPEIIITVDDLFENDSQALLNKINEKIMISKNFDYQKYYYENFSNAVIQKKYKELLYQV